MRGERHTAHSRTTQGRNLRLRQVAIVPGSKLDREIDRCRGNQHRTRRCGPTPHELRGKRWPVRVTVTQPEFEAKRAGGHARSQDARNAHVFVIAEQERVRSVGRDEITVVLGTRNKMLGDKLNVGEFRLRDTEASKCGTQSIAEPRFASNVHGGEAVLARCRIEQSPLDARQNDIETARAAPRVGGFGNGAQIIESCTETKALNNVEFPLGANLGSRHRSRSSEL